MHDLHAIHAHHACVLCMCKVVSCNAGQSSTCSCWTAIATTCSAWYKTFSVRLRKRVAAEQLADAEARAELAARELLGFEEVAERAVDNCTAGSALGRGAAWARRVFWTRGVGAVLPPTAGGTTARAPRSRRTLQKGSRGA